MLISIMSRAIITIHGGCGGERRGRLFYYCSHTFWVICKLVWILTCLFFLQNHSSLGDFVWFLSLLPHSILEDSAYVQMGGERRQVEPVDCEGLRANQTIWRILEKGNFTPYIDKLHGWDPKATKIFARGWNDGKINLFGRTMVVDENLIAEITSLPTQGLKFYKDRKYSDSAVKKFPKLDKERKLLVKKNKSCYDADTVKPI